MCDKSSATRIIHHCKDSHTTYLCFWFFFFLFDLLCSTWIRRGRGRCAGFTGTSSSPVRGEAWLDPAGVHCEWLQERALGGQLELSVRGSHAHHAIQHRFNQEAPCPQCGGCYHCDNQRLAIIQLLSKSQETLKKQEETPHHLIR